MSISFECWPDSFPSSSISWSIIDSTISKAFQCAFISSPSSSCAEWLSGTLDKASKATSGKLSSRAFSRILIWVRSSRSKATCLFISSSVMDILLILSTALYMDKTLGSLGFLLGTLISSFTLSIRALTFFSNDRVLVALKGRDVESLVDALRAAISFCCSYSRSCTPKGTGGPSFALDSFDEDGAIDSASSPPSSPSSSSS